ncbi:hypothetical protein Tco_1386169 [Tanacetum coccineum]
MVKSTYRGLSLSIDGEKRKDGGKRSNVVATFSKADTHLALALNENPHSNYYAKDPDKCMSINGYAFLVHGCVVSWKATLQHVMALSTTEAEYMALTEIVNEAIWLRGLLEELGVKLNTMAVNYDNQGAIHLSRNHVFPKRIKHINVHYHFIREVLKVKTVQVLKVGTEHNDVNALTKLYLDSSYNIVLSC